MKYGKMQKWRNMLVLMLAGVSTALGEETNDPLKPPDVTSDDGNIVLHKQAERIGPDEWEVTVSATVNTEPVKAPPLEVVFVLDVSSTMNACAVMEQHNSYFNGGGFTHIHTPACPSTMRMATKSSTMPRKST